MREIRLKICPKVCIYINIILNNLYGLQQILSLSLYLSLSLSLSLSLNPGKTEFSLAAILNCIPMYGANSPTTFKWRAIFFWYVVQGTGFKRTVYATKSFSYILMYCNYVSYCGEFTHSWVGSQISAALLANVLVSLRISYNFNSYSWNKSLNIKLQMVQNSLARIYTVWLCLLRVLALHSALKILQNLPIAEWNWISFSSLFGMPGQSIQSIVYVSIYISDQSVILHQ